MSETMCERCRQPAVGVMFTKGAAEDLALCKRCGLAPEFRGWASQSFTTADSPVGRMIRARVKGV